MILGVHKFNVLGSGEAVDEDGKVFGAGDASGAYFCRIDRCRHLATVLSVDQQE